MKRAIIIGASSGMGLEISKLLLADGWHIGAAARRRDRLEQLKAIDPSKVDIEMIDVTSDDAPLKTKGLIDRMGGINLFVYVSGIGHQNRLLDIHVERDTLITNALGFTQMIDTAFNYMANNCGGQIAVISSIAGTKGLGAAPSYSATKAFQNKYIQSIEQLANMRHLHIHFTDIRPGFVDTDLLNDGNRYPLLMKKEKVAKEIVNAIYDKKHVWVIDWRWRVITFFWQLIPNIVWRRMNI